MQPQHFQPQNHPPQPQPPESRTNQMAIAAVVAGAVGWFGVPIVASIIAIICGHMARQQIRQTGEEGDALAILGLVLGYTHMVAVCVGVTLVIALYGGIAAFFIANGVAQ